MSVVDLTAEEYADMLRVSDCVQLPVAVKGYLYMVVKGELNGNVYRVSIA